MEYLDGKLGPTEAKEVEAHLDSCTQCQELRRNWVQLDSELMRRQPAKLSADFEANLRLRIENTTTNEPALRPPHEFERDWLAGSFAADLRFLRSQLFHLVDGVGVAAAVTLGGYLFLKLVSKLPATSLGVFGGKLLSWGLQIGTIAGLLVAAGGIALASRRRVFRWLAAF